MVTVIRILGLLALTATGGIIGLAAWDKNVPEVLNTIAIASLTGLAGVLAPNTGLLSTTRASRRAALAGEAAAVAVIASTGEDVVDESKATAPTHRADPDDEL